MGVATQTTSLSAAVCPFGRLHEVEGWQRGAERPKNVLRSIFCFSNVTCVSRISPGACC